MPGTIPILRQLMATIELRKKAPTTESYTAQLLTGGVEVIGAKILEEAEEVVDAARGDATRRQREQLIHEAADLIYHLCVMLVHRGVTLEDVEAKLESRFSVSGLAEKAARSHPREVPSEGSPPSEGSA